MDNSELCRYALEPCGPCGGETVAAPVTEQKSRAPANVDVDLPYGTKAPVLQLGAASQLPF